MRRWIGLAGATAGAIAALGGALTMDRGATGVAPLLLLPFATGVLAWSLLPTNRLGSGFLALVLAIVGGFFVPLALARLHEQRFGWADPEGLAAFQAIYWAASLLIGPLLAAGLAQQSRPPH